MVFKKGCKRNGKVCPICNNIHKDMTIKVPWNKNLTKEIDERVKSTLSTRKGKSWEEIYGIEKTKNMKEYKKGH